MVGAAWAFVIADEKAFVASGKAFVAFTKNF
jgi:hypothetical protein